LSVPALSIAPDGTPVMVTVTVLLSVDAAAMGSDTQLRQVGIRSRNGSSPVCPIARPHSEQRSIARQGQPV
jgi:hypothetical protein